MVASYVFYGWWDWRFLLLIAFTSLCSYVFGLLISKNLSEGKDRKARGYNVLNIVINIAAKVQFNLKTNEKTSHFYCGVNENDYLCTDLKQK